MDYSKEMRDTIAHINALFAAEEKKHTEKAEGRQVPRSEADVPPSKGLVEACRTIKALHAALRYERGRSKAMQATLVAVLASCEADRDHPVLVTWADIAAALRGEARLDWRKEQLYLMSVARNGAEDK